jgi:hypothetical protein
MCSQEWLPSASVARFLGSNLAEVSGFLRAMKIHNQKETKAGVPHLIYLQYVKEPCIHDKRKLKAKSDIIFPAHRAPYSAASCHCTCRTAEASGEQEWEQLEKLLNSTKVCWMTD